MKLVSDLRYKSAKPVPMRPTTIRIPWHIEEEIKRFALQHGIRYSVLIRECVERGWESICREIDDEDAR